MIAPTTLLARQHYKSFAERFRGFPIDVRQLSRFVSAKDAQATRDSLSRGTVDIVIGTHAVLAKQVRFKDLGLLIIDEEQHFGVSHKERLKQLRTDVHVLTLTATPIPRTLQLSLTGVRDLSIIGTPPVDRLAIRTYVSEFDTVTIREALLREHYRGGQSFFVVPRIADLPEMEDFLKEQVPEVSYVVAHGQMAAGELDDRMNAFYDGKYDVLLATTIVESGLDIPTANTMIIHRADMFGLAQLYQIRAGWGARRREHMPISPRSPARNSRKTPRNAFAFWARSTAWAPGSRLPARISTFAARATFWAKSNPARSAKWAMSFTNPCLKRRLPRSGRARWRGFSMMTINGRPRSTLASRF